MREMSSQERGREGRLAVQVEDLRLTCSVDVVSYDLTLADSRDFHTEHTYSGCESLLD